MSGAGQVQGRAGMTGNRKTFFLVKVSLLRAARRHPGVGSTYLFQVDGAT